MNHDAATDDGFWRCRRCGAPQGDVFRICLECGASRPESRRAGGLGTSLVVVAGALALAWLLMAALRPG